MVTCLIVELEPSITAGFTGNSPPQEIYPSFSNRCDMGAIYSTVDKSNACKVIQQNFGVTSDRKLAKKLHIGKSTIQKWRNALGLKIIKNTVNENYFDNWNPEMAYVLGLIATDGNVSWNPKKGYQSLTITAAEKDKEHLEKIRQLLKSAKPLLYAESTKSYRLIVNSKKICQDLMAFGIVPAKSKILKFQPVPVRYLQHYIRGVVDGDGTVRYCSREKGPYFEINICFGSRVFLGELARQVEKMGINATVRESRPNFFIVRYTCKRAMKFANWIYADADLYLKRKFVQFQIALDSKKEE